MAVNPPGGTPAGGTPAARTRASLACAGLLLLFGLCQLGWAGASGPEATNGLVGSRGLGMAAILGPLSILAAALLLRLDRFETRLLVGLVASTQVVLGVLDTTLGLPGQEARGWGVRAVLELVLPALVLLLLEADRRARAAARSSLRRAASTYSR